MSHQRIIELVHRIVVEHDFQTLSHLTLELRKLLAEERAEFEANHEDIREQLMKR